MHRWTGSKLHVSVSFTHDTQNYMGLRFRREMAERGLDARCSLLWGVPPMYLQREFAVSHLPTFYFLLSWRRLQWERPHALLEEWERFIKDWRDCTLAVFYWRIPPFLRASLLQQHRYVCFIPPACFYYRNTKCFKANQVQKIRFPSILDWNGWIYAVLFLPLMSWDILRKPVTSYLRYFSRCGKITRSCY